MQVGRVVITEVSRCLSVRQTNGYLLRKRDVYGSFVRRGSEAESKSHVVQACCQYARCLFRRKVVAGKFTFSSSRLDRGPVKIWEPVAGSRWRIAFLGRGEAE
jgi:hypothetical protein